MHSPLSCHRYVPNLAFFHLLSQSIEEAGVGTFQGLQVASPSSSVREAVARLVTGRVAALPVLDQTGRLAGVFSQEDVVTLAAQDPGINLALPLAEAVQLRPPGPAHCCSGLRLAHCHTGDCVCRGRLCAGGGRATPPLRHGPAGGDRSSRPGPRHCSRLRHHPILGKQIRYAISLLKKSIKNITLLILSFKCCGFFCLFIG